MICLDTNLLVYAHRSSVREHAASRRAIERAHARGCGISLSSVPEFWSVVTHPLCQGGPSTHEQAMGFLAALGRAGIPVWTPGSNFGARLMRLAADLGIAGARIFDLQIALVASDNGATEIWTHDRSFVPMPGLSVSDPLSPI